MIPVRWMAPETLRYSCKMKFTVASDVWAYGVTIWEVYTYGELPYFLLNNDEARRQILNGLTLDIPEQCPESIKNVMKLSWKFDPSRRCSFDEIVAIIEESETDITVSLIRRSEEDRNEETNGWYTIILYSLLKTFS